MKYFLVHLFLILFRACSTVAESTMNKPLRTFLQRSLSQVRLMGPGAVSSGGATFVLGNEAADADSIISSLTYAYLKKWQLDDTPRRSDHDNLKNPIIPITSIKRSEIHLRRDVQLLLIEVGMELSDLICVDECNIEKISLEKRLDLILVDHNKLSNSITSLLCTNEDHCLLVKEIIDHHEDSGAYPAVAVREVEFDMMTKKPEVGSTCTIVAEKYLQHENIGALNIDIATLLIAVIAVDTLNMDPVKKRGTVRDQAALDSLQLHFPDVQRDRLFSLLMNAKTDPLFWESLSAKDTLLLDCKEFQFERNNKYPTDQPYFSFSVPSVLQSAKSFLNKSDLDDELVSYFYPNSDCSSLQSPDSFLYNGKPEKINAIMVVMTLTFQPEIKRSLIFFSNNKERIKSISSYLSDEKLNVQLSPFDPMENICVRVPDDRGDIYMACCYQGNIEMSRKQIAPLISNFNI